MTYRVLIVEDDPFIALDLETTMEDAGFEVLGPVASAVEAMRILNTCREDPDCALIDFYITGGTSESIARELSERDVPLIVVTGNRDDAMKSLEDFTDLVRCKPVAPARIVRDVRNAVSA